MELILVVAMLVLNFSISWFNAKYCGRYWSESKNEGGGFRAYIVCGFIQSVAGFTMVYAYVLLLLAPGVMQMCGVDQESILYFEELASNLTYLIIVFPIVSTGFFIWLRGIQITWENRTLGNILTSGWNTYAQLHNTISAFRNVPSAFGKVVDALIGGKKKKGKEVLAMLAILLVILAICSGYFTASAIMKKADREYDAYDELRRKAAERA